MDASNVSKSITPCIWGARTDTF